jgi:hypothetical protein
MKRKWLAVGINICAVVLLVLGSLSNVVGYQSVQSTAVNDSPLFKTRTQRAINQQQNILTSQYLGKGNNNLSFFPVKDNRTQSLIRVIKIINKMDDTNFEEFTKFFNQKARQDPSLKYVNSNEISQILYLLKTNPETIIKSFTDRKNQNITSSGFYSVCHWFPGCIPANILFTIVEAIVFLVVIIVLGPSFLKSCIPTCSDGSFCGNRCLYRR